MKHFRLYVVIHFYTSIPVMLMFLVHLYLGSIGNKGVFKSIIYGKIGKTAVMKYHSEAGLLK